MVKHSLCLLGEVCPIPLLKTKEYVEKLAVGEKLTVETDFTRSVRNIMNWCNKEGHDMVINETDKGVWEIIVTKK